MQLGDYSPTPNPSPLERGVNTLASCWRTGHGDHRPTISPTPVPSPLERGVNTSTSCWRTGHGDPHPTMVCKANLSRIGASVPHPPATNVISPATNEISPATNVISPTTNKISPALNILINSGVLEDVARRPPSYYGLQGYSLPSIRGGGSRVSGAGVGLLGQVPLEKCGDKSKVPPEKC